MHSPSWPPTLFAVTLSTDDMQEINADHEVSLVLLAPITGQMTSKSGSLVPSKRMDYVQFKEPNALTADLSAGARSGELVLGCNISSSGSWDGLGLSYPTPTIASTPPTLAGVVSICCLLT